MSVHNRKRVVSRLTFFARTGPFIQLSSRILIKHIQIHSSLSLLVNLFLSLHNRILYGSAVWRIIHLDAAFYLTLCPVSFFSFHTSESTTLILFSSNETPVDSACRPGANRVLPILFPPNLPTNKRFINLLDLFEKWVCLSRRPHLITEKLPIRDIRKHFDSISSVSRPNHHFVHYTFL